MATRTAADVVWYGQASPADVQARDICIDDAGRARFTLTAPSGAAPVTLRVRGEHCVSNALATAAVAHALGMSAATIAAALSRAQPLSSGRMQVLERGDGVTIINDAFNANPESMGAGLRTLATMAAGRRSIAVLGEMRELGDYAMTAHEQAGQLVGELGIAMLVAVGTDDAQALTDTARRTNPAISAKVVSDRHAAADLLRDQLKPGDIVLVKASRSLQLEDLATTLAAGSATPASQQP
jgi:UDP-N-acetylmuramoyl-tripeptide--D-alanyl-D-alanine ligase